jgi:TatD DNase family protein
VITYKTNLNTAQVVRAMGGDLRIVLETDAPFMVPSNVYAAIPELGSSSRAGRLPLSHAAMIPWTAACVAEVANEAAGEEAWDVPRVLAVARENARKVYGI